VSFLRNISKEIKSLLLAFTSNYVAIGKNVCENRVTFVFLQAKMVNVTYGTMVTQYIGITS